MLRIIIVVVLSALAVVQSGCDKIKTELERRHLGSETHKSASSAAPDYLKTLSVNQPVNKNDVKGASERTQIIFRIDLPADEKIQIRLIKSQDSEETTSDSLISSKEPPVPKDDVFHDRHESPAELEKKSQPKQTDEKDEGAKSEMKSDAEPESHSEMKTDSEEAFPQPPVIAPTVVVPARETASESALPEERVKTTLASERFEPTPAEKAVGLALSAPKPETILPASDRAITIPRANAAAASSPWAIPNAEYPLRYYQE